MSSTAHWQLRVDSDGIAWLALDKRGASTNSLSRDVMEELQGHVQSLEQSKPRAVVLYSGKAQGFIAGADIKEFVGIKSAAEGLPLIRQGQSVLDRLEALSCPTVAAINGFALGGGLEVALACRYRVVAESDQPSLGFPEVMLGLHPGFGGTVRAVQLAGPIGAMELMLTGRSLRPKQALQMGLIDRIVPQSRLLDEAKNIALAQPPRAKGKFQHALLNLPPMRSFLAKRMRLETARRARPEHYPAPYALIELWAKHGGKGPRAMEAEAESMARLIETPTSRNLVRVFFLQERLKSFGKEATEAKHVHVVGAGVMGGDIAAWCAIRGLNVTLQDRADDYVNKALERSRELFAKRVRDDGKRREVEQRLRSDVPGDGVKQADVVIEAIYENVQAKQELYGRVEPSLRPDAVLATNTSSIMLEQLDDTLAQPRRLVGLHFFNPVPKMPLVEVIRSEQTDDAVLQRALGFVRQIDKLPLPCRSSPGFVVNRVLMPYLTQAVRAIDEGIPFEVIDSAAESFGMPMGPVELADVVGLDVILSVGKVMFESAGVTVPKVLTDRVEQKQLGSKTGRGFYEWQDGKPQKKSGAASVPPDLQDRLILALVNEAVAVLREGIVADADLIDAGVIFGAGFAPFRGGPIQYARDRGVAEVVSRLHALAKKYGSDLSPDAGWQLLR